MKTHHFFIFLSLLTVSCTKEKVEDVPDPTDAPTPIYPISIRAGQDTGIGIRHVDFSPDLIFNIYPLYDTSDSIKLDLNSDNIDDFILTYRSYTVGVSAETMDIKPLDNNQVCVIAAHPDLADSIRFNELIDSSAIWSNENAQLYYVLWASGAIQNGTGYFHYNHNYYIGVKLNANGHVSYGWIYLNSNAIDKYSITKAYCN